MQYKRELCAAALGLLACTAVEAQDFWQKVNGPPGGANIRVLAADGSGSFYAGSFGDGLFRSTNNGQIWSPINNGLKTLYVWSLASGAQGQLYLGAGGVYRSTDSGDHWVPTDSSIANFAISAIAVNANGDVFAGASFVGAISSSSIFRSTNQGSTWVPIGTSIPANDVLTIAINQPGHVFIGGQIGIYRSMDNGATWRQRQNGIISGTSRAIVACANGYLFSGAAEGVYRSIDNGDSWQLLRNGLTSKYDVYSLAIGTNDQVFAGTASGLFHSADYGESWRSISAGTAIANHLAQCLALNKNGVLAMGSGQGVFRSPTPAFHWEYSSTGMKEAGISAMTFNQNGTRLAGTSVGIYKAENQSENWTPIEASPPAGIFAHSPNGKIYAGTFRFGLFVSADSGENWSKVQSYDQTVEATALAINSMGHIFCGGTFNSGLFRSTNDGESWTWIRAIGGQMAITPDNTIFLPNVFRSTDNGDHWQQVTNGLLNRDVTTLAADSQGKVFAATRGGGVYRTTDNGEHWNATALISAVVAMNVNSRDHIFAQTGSQVLQSKDSGDRWGTISSGLGTASVAQFVFDPAGYAYAITNRGLYRSVESTTIVEERSGNVPSSFILYQNHPNPFNAGTEIRYELPAGKTSYPVSLAIYDLQGRLIKQLVNAAQSPGAHSVVWEGTDANGQPVPSQVYIYTLYVGDFKATKKLLLLK